MVSPSNDIIDGLPSADCFYRFLFKVLVGEGRSSSHYFFQDLSWQPVKEELTSLGVSCLIPRLSCQFFESGGIFIDEGELELQFFQVVPCSVFFCRVLEPLAEGV